MSPQTKQICAGLLLVLASSLQAAIPSDGKYAGSAKVTFTVRDLELTTKNTESVKAVVRSGSFGLYDREVIVLGPQDRKFFEYFTNNAAPTTTHLAHIFFNSITGAASIDFIGGQLTSTIQGSSRSLKVTFSTPTAAVQISGVIYGADLTLALSLAKQ